MHSRLATPRTAEVAEKVRARDEAAQMLAEARSRARDAAYFADLASGGPARRRRYVLLGFVGTFAVGFGILALIHFAHTWRGSRARQQAEIVAQFEVFTNQVCACTDRTCAERVTDAMTAWATKLAATADDDDKPAAKWLAKMQELGERMGTCMVKTMTEAAEAAEATP